MRLVRILLLITLLAPSSVFAAGFAKQSLFLSQSSVTEGDTVRIYTTVSNDETSPFVGHVVLKDNSATIGSLSLTLAAGAAQVLSAPWSPTTGSHTVTADLVSTGGTVDGEESATFSVAPQPVLQINTAAGAGQAAAPVESSAQIQQDIAQVSPQAAQVTKPLFTTIDNLRSQASGVLNTQLASTKNNLAKTPQPGIVAGAATQDTAISNPWGALWFVLYTLYLYTLTILIFIISNAGVFYPVLAVAFLYLLWRLYRRMRRPY